MFNFGKNRTTDASDADAIVEKPSFHLEIPPGRWYVGGIRWVMIDGGDDYDGRCKVALVYMDNAQELNVAVCMCLIFI